MKVSRLLPCVTLLALFGVAPNASATIVEVEYTGVVRSGTDGGGLFGPQGADLTRQPFVLDFIFDTNIGVVTRQPTLNVIVGGSDAGSPFDVSPNLSAEIEINGRTSPKIVGSVFSVMQAANGKPGNVNQQLHSASDGVNTLFGCGSGNNRLQRRHPGQHRCSPVFRFRSDGRGQRRGDIRRDELEPRACDFGLFDCPRGAHMGDDALRPRGHRISRRGVQQGAAPHLGRSSQKHLPISRHPFREVLGHCADASEAGACPRG